MCAPPNVVFGWTTEVEYELKDCIEAIFLSTPTSHSCQCIVQVLVQGSLIIPSDISSLVVLPYAARGHKPYKGCMTQICCVSCQSVIIREVSNVNGSKYGKYSYVKIWISLHPGSPQIVLLVEFLLWVIQIYPPPKKNLWYVEIYPQNH